jgi:oligosaccharide repeat unit polymerase
MIVEISLVISFLFLFCFFVWIRKTILSPSVIIAACFFLESFVWLLIANQYSIRLHWSVYFVLVFGVFFIFLGEEIGRNFDIFAHQKLSLQKIHDKGARREIENKHNGKYYYEPNNSDKRVPFNSKTMLVILFFLCLTTALYLYEDYHILITYNGGSFPSFSTAYGMLRAAMNSGSSVSSLLARMTEISFVLVIYCLYLLITNLFSKRIKLIDLLPTICVCLFVFIGFLTSGRTYLERTVIAILVIALYILFSKYAFWEAVKRSFFMAFICLIVFGLGFSVAGLMRSSGGSTMGKQLYSFGFYVASSIPAFDLYLLNPVYNQTQFWGAHVFYGFYSFLSNFTTAFDEIMYMPLEMVNIGQGMATNIYTAFRRYYQDFGAFGVIFFPTLMGSFYGVFLEQWKRSKHQLLYLTIFSFEAFPLFEYGVEERFFTGVISGPGIFAIFLFILAYWVFISKGFLIKNESNS